MHQAAGCPHGKPHRKNQTEPQQPPAWISGYIFQIPLGHRCHILRHHPADLAHGFRHIQVHQAQKRTHKYQQRKNGKQQIIGQRCAVPGTSWSKYRFSSCAATCRGVRRRFSFLLKGHHSPIFILPHNLKDEKPFPRHFCGFCQNEGDFSCIQIKNFVFYLFVFFRKCDKIFTNQGKFICTLKN